MINIYKNQIPCLFKLILANLVKKLERIAKYKIMMNLVKKIKKDSKKNKKKTMKIKRKILLNKFQRTETSGNLALENRNLSPH